MKYGIFTPYTSILYSECYNEKTSNFLKKNAILFDHLVLVPQGLGPIGESGFNFTKMDFLNGRTGEKIKYKSDLEKILLLIDDFVDNEPERDEFYNPTNDNESMWSGSQSDNYIEFVTDYVVKKYNKESLSQLTRDEYKELKWYVGTISYDFQVLSNATKKFDNFSAMFSEIHENAFRSTYKNYDFTLDKGNVISEVEEISFFDFGEFTWDEIITLRKSEFIDDFRNKIQEWTTEYIHSTNKIEFENKLEKYISDAKFDFIERRRPSLTKTSILGILGNIPLPIPVNPVSILSTVNDVRKDFKDKKDFDWLFFIQKAYKMNNKK